MSYCSSTARRRLRQTDLVTQVNKQVRLAARPSGLPTASDWTITSEPVPAPGPGQFVVAVSYVSIDPAMRGWMNAARAYIAPAELGAGMPARAIGKVTASEHPGFAVGDDVFGVFGVQDYAVSDGKGVSKLDSSLAPLTAYLGVLGMTGLTAYFGLFDIGRIAAGDTVVVSGAAGGGGQRGGPDRQAQGVHGDRHRGRPGQAPDAAGGVRLRRGARLQERRPARGPAAARAGRRRCVLRQRGRRRPRRGADPPGQ